MVLNFFPRLPGLVWCQYAKNCFQYSCFAFISRKALAEKYIMTSAKLIAPAIGSSFALANDLEINKAITYLRQRVETLKMLEKKDSRVKSAAATNIYFLYYIEKDFDQADNYAELAMSADHYNPAALVSKGNTEFVKEDYEKAPEFYKEALRNDSSCTEKSLYRPAGLTYKKLCRLDKALDCFLKLHAILRNSAPVMHQLNKTLLCNNFSCQEIEWMLNVYAQVLTKLGDLYENEGDKSQAFQYYYEYFPSNISVIEWLGAYYIDTQFCEKAIQYFERTTLIHCWWLAKALETYKDIHQKFPENVIFSLRFLVRLCTDMGLIEVQNYATKLKKVEKIREQRVRSGREGSARGLREGSTGSGEKESFWPGLCLLKCIASIEFIILDALYVDPLGPQMQRLKTAARKHTEEDECADEEAGDDLLPE
uniref:Intraflagellar transport 88 homolog n=1 Tax=Cyprinus carpio carpio TaxID=630221 RepID=A0A9J8DF30_CYPCA